MFELSLTPAGRHVKARLASNEIDPICWITGSLASILTGFALDYIILGVFV